MFGSPPLSISPKSPRSVSVHARGEALLGLLERSFLQEMFALSRNTTCLEYVSMLRLTPGSCLPAARAAPGLSLVRCAAPWEQLGGCAWFKDTRKVLSFAFPPPIFPPRHIVYSNWRPSGHKRASHPFYFAAALQ